MVAPATIVDPREAQLERIKREQARRDQVAFSEYVAPFYRPATHHRLVGQYLNQVAAFIQTGGHSGIGRLMIYEPPRHGKTEQAAQLFPAWLLGRMPDARIIITAYGADLAQRSSRAIRNYVTSPRYQAIFGERSTLDAPVRLSEDSYAASEWDLAAPHRGGVNAAGVGGGITGKGAHLLVIDDPFKNRDDAESDIYREKVWNWYTSSAYTRLEDGAAIVLMHTRWHSDDLAGKLLKQMVSGDPLADQWIVVCLPGLGMAEEEYAPDPEAQKREMAAGVFTPIEDLLRRAPGQALWPEKYSAADVEHIAANIGPYDFAALYQQRPRPRSGGFFAEGGFGEVEAAPEGLRWFRYVDLAISEKTTADWNATIATALDAEGGVYYRDMLRLRGWNEYRERLIQLMISKEEQGTEWAVEATGFQSLAFQEIIADKRVANVAIRKIEPEKDKVSRARPLQTRCDLGKVKLVRGAWVPAFLREAMDFPTGAHDDQIDTASGGLEMAAEAEVLSGQLVF